jgi:hypothetical protein
MRAEQQVSVPRCGQLAVLTACRARGARFAVAQDARRDDPGLGTIRNPGNVGSDLRANPRDAAPGLAPVKPGQTRRRSRFGARSILAVAQRQLALLQLALYLVVGGICFCIRHRGLYCPAIFRACDTHCIGHVVRDRDPR